VAAEGDDESSRPDPGEKATEERDMLASFETLKKAADVTNEALQQQLLEDVAAHRALATA
jgi:hypothetical protein